MLADTPLSLFTCKAISLVAAIFPPIMQKTGDHPTEEAEQSPISNDSNFLIMSE